jgi:arylsulfatase
MVTRMDRDVGRLVEELKRQGVYDNTLIVFSSDNGPTFNGGSDSEFFESNGPFSGLKCSLREGGIRVPMIAVWPGRIRPGRVTDHVSAQWDLLATLAEVSGGKAPEQTDGISLLPTLLGEGKQRGHDYLYWEYGDQQAVRVGTWKGYRPRAKKKPDDPILLFDLETDPAEQHDVAAEHPDVVRKMVGIMNARTPSHIDRWNLPPAPMPAAPSGE